MLIIGFCDGAVTFPLLLMAVLASHSRLLAVTKSSTFKKKNVEAFILPDQPFERKRNREQLAAKKTCSQINNQTFQASELYVRI